MPLGIGGGGWAGLAFEVLPPPVLSGSPTAGGALTAGAYRYKITALNANGETLPSNEVTVTTASGNLTSALTWSAVPDATGYKVYRTAAGGATNTELLLATLGNVTSYNDAAVGAPSGAMPTDNTATAPNVYVAPTKLFPFNSETLKKVQDTQWRRPIRQSVDVAGISPGNVHIEGDIEMEVFEDLVPYFLFAARGDLVRTGSAPNYIYTFTPNNVAVPQRTLSITVERVDGSIFGYTGCIISQMKFSIDNGEMMVTWSILGSDETDGTDSMLSFNDSQSPFGAGQYDVEIGGSQVFDTDTFEFTVDDAGTSQFRMKNNGRGAQFQSYGERTVTLQLERDFVDKTEYDEFVAYTSKDISIAGVKGINNSVTVDMPVATIDTYEVNLSGQGDLVRATVNYQGIKSGGPSYTIVTKTQELVG